MSNADAKTKKNHAGAAFLAQLGEDASLFTLGSSVSKIIKIASDGDEAVSELTYFVLSDVALTQKILRLANTAVYRSRSGSAITTISRAIFALGFETVRLSALALILVEGISDKRQAQSVARELSLALRASVIARKTASIGPFKGDEDVAIAALFKNFGALLLASHDHGLYQAVRSLVESGELTLAQACSETLGCSFDALATSAMQKWQIPDSVFQAATRVAPRLSAPAVNRRDWQQQAVAFSIEAAKALPLMAPDGAPAAAEKALQDLLDRFGPALSLDPAGLRGIFEAALKEAGAIESGFEFESLGDLSAQNDSEQDTGGLPDELLLMGSSDPCGQPAGRHPSGKPLNSRELLLAGVQDATQMLALSNAKASELMLFILETLHTSMGFRFSAICIRDAQTGLYRARMSLGEGHLARQAGFQFTPVAGSCSRDLFQLAMEKEADLTISDASSPKIRALIPAWHRELLPDAQSFIVLPLVVQKKAVGFFYADRPLCAPEGVPPEEATLLKMLKGQALTALKPRS